MSPLQERLAELRTRVRQILWVYGLCWLTVVLLGALLVVGCTDWWLHLDDSGVRLILGLAILGGAGYVAWRRLITPLKVPLGDLDLALRIERRFPKFRDSLASTVQFLESNQDPGLGAPALQKKVIDATLKQAKSIDFEDVVQTQPVQRIAWTALMVCLTTGLVVGLNQAEAATAIKRLVFPFGSHPWPRQTQLQFVNHELEVLVADPHAPLRIARGDTLELTAVNLNRQGRMPNNVQLELRHADGSITREPMQRTTLRTNQEKSREAAFASLVIKTPFQFRAVGGDDQTMEWFPLEVVPPPVTESLQVRLVPPKYTHRPAVKLPAGVGHVEGLVGTRVEITARANKPLGSAQLKIRDKDVLPVTLGKDGVQLTTSFVIKEAGIYSWWLDLRDKQNFGNSDAPRYEVRAIQDTPPDIYIDRPATDIQVTPTAEVPLRFVAKDDLGLREIRLRYQILEPGKTELGKPVEVTLATLEKRPLQHTQEHVWQLESLQLTPGSQVQLHAEATDDYDLGGAHVGRSLTRTLTVVSPEEKTQELADRQVNLLTEIERTKKQETEIQVQTAELQKQLEKTGTLRPQDLDLLQRIEGQQRQLSGALQNSQDGMLSRAAEMLKELQQNHLQAPETEQRLGQIRTELQRLADQHLAEIEQDLTQARKLAGGMAPAEQPVAATKTAAGESPKKPETTSPDTKGPMSPEASGTKPADGAKPGKPANPETGKPEESEAGKPSESSDKPDAEQPPESLRPGATPTEQALHQARQHQRAVTDSLGDLLRELSQWQDERQAALDLQEIRQGQEKINQETAELAQKTVSKALQELKPQETADLARQVERQKHQATQMDQMQRRMSEVVKKLEEENSPAADRMRDILEQLQHNNTAGKMKDAAGQIGENQMGKAGQTQQEIARDLQDLENALKNRPTSDLETLVKQMKETGQELEKLFEEQEELIKKSKEAEKLTDPQQKSEEIESLKKKQEELQQKAGQLARKLGRMQMQAAADAAERAAQRMEDSLEKLEKEKDQADKQAEEALQDLEQARRELAKEQQQAEERLAFEQIEKIANEIVSLMKRQQGVLEETKRLDAARAASGNWSRPQLKTLIDLAATQRNLKTETTGLVEKLSAAEVFALAVKGAVRHMEEAAGLLDQRETGAGTQQFEKGALQRFQDLVKALEQDSKPKAEEQNAQQQNGNAGGQEQSGPPVDTVAMIAQLKMLRTLQFDINARIVTLGEKRDSGSPLTPAELAELKALGEEQGDLAELAAKFLEMFEAGQKEKAEKPADQPAQQGM